MNWVFSPDDRLFLTRLKNPDEKTISAIGNKSNIGIETGFGMVIVLCNKLLIMVYDDYDRMSDSNDESICWYRNYFNIVETYATIKNITEVIVRSIPATASHLTAYGDKYINYLPKTDMFVNPKNALGRRYMETSLHYYKYIKAVLMDNEIASPVCDEIISEVTIALQRK